MIKRQQYTAISSLYTHLGTVFIRSECVYTCVSVSRFGSSLFLHLEELCHVGEIFLVRFGHLLLRGLRVDDLQTLQELHEFSTAVSDIDGVHDLLARGLEYRSKQVC